MKIKALLKHTALERFDAEILLAHVLQVDRSYLHTWPQRELEDTTVQVFQALAKRCSQGEPIAYLLGEKEFWSLNFKVNSAVLIPRPETELLVEAALKLMQEQPVQNVLELGIGSGAISVALAHECPKINFTAVDKSAAALEVAQFNAVRHRCHNIQFLLSDWLNEVRGTFDIIISNPPYLSQEDQHLPALAFEPQEALVAGESGLEDYEKILKEAKRFLNPQAKVLFEHGATQAHAVRILCQKYGFKHLVTLQDLAGLDRATWIESK